MLKVGDWVIIKNTGDVNGPPKELIGKVGSIVTIQTNVMGDNTYHYVRFDNQSHMIWFLKNEIELAVNNKELLEGIIE